MVNKASAGPSTTPGIAEVDKKSKHKFKKVFIDDQIKDDLGQEITSDSKQQNLSKYIKNFNKPFEYKDQYKGASKLKNKYFYPGQLLKDKNMNIKNYDTSVNFDYDEGKMVNTFDKGLVYAQNFESNFKSNQTYDKPVASTNYTSKVPNNRSYDGKMTK